MYAIKVENLSKEYQIVQQGNFNRLGERIYGLIHRMFSFSKKQTQIHKVLSDISFEVKKGEVLGIIGQNGAGKTTLLKILSRITQPTFGEIKIYGKVVSLLEIGTGINLELTGRENIYLNGAILGMKKSEILEKYDDIVDFAGINHFIDIPMKKYSSGMQTRLAFAIATHVEADVLLVDEVLAVGDLKFQKECVKKMETITQSKGKTILFVSHDMGTVRNLCTSCTYLKDGKIFKSGETEEVVNCYLKDNDDLSENYLESRIASKGEKDGQLIDFYCLNEKKEKVKQFFSGKQAILRFVLFFEKINKSDRIFVYIGVNSSFGNRIATISNEYTGDEIINNLKKKNVDLLIPKLPFSRGEYYLDATIKVNNFDTDNVRNFGKIVVESGGFYANETMSVSKSNRGHFLFEHSWQSD